MVKEISWEELKAKMDRGDDFVLVEVLSRRHFKSSHLPGAINLPYEFIDEAERVLPDKRAEIVVYCMNEECESSREEARELGGDGLPARPALCGRQARLDQGWPPRGRSAGPHVMQGTRVT